MSTTLFKQVGYSLGTLISYLEMGNIGLPHIQRPFVWKNIKVRDLFDSMYNGYPVGYLLLWENAFSGEARQTGTDANQRPPATSGDSMFDKGPRLRSSRPTRSLIT
jgi:hypothetical protein